jgi:DNA-binding NarL/FixJ family response regulator
MMEAAKGGFDRLSARERQVLSALMRGETARDISRESFVSLPTVRSQIRSILIKLGVSSQLGAVVLAYRSGWNGERGAGPADEPERLVVGM